MWQHYRDESALGNNGNIIGFPDDSNNSASFKFKQEIKGRLETVAQKILK